MMKSPLDLSNTNMLLSKLAHIVHDQPRHLVLLGMCTNNDGGYLVGISAMAPHKPSAIMTVALLNLILALSAERKYSPVDMPMPMSGRSTSQGNFLMDCGRQRALCHPPHHQRRRGTNKWHD